MSLIHQHLALIPILKDDVDLITVGKIEPCVYQEAVDASGLEADVGIDAGFHGLVIASESFMEVTQPAVSRGL